MPILSNKTNVHVTANLVNMLIILFHNITKEIIIYYNNHNNHLLDCAIIP